MNLATGIKAQINREQRNKILDDTAVEKSKTNGFSANQHYAVAERVGKAWEQAEFASEAPDRDGNPNIKSIKRFTSPIFVDSEAAVA